MKVHDDRMWMAGSLGLPDVVVASRVGEWGDFRLGSKPDPDREGETLPVTEPSDLGLDGAVSTDADGFWREQSVTRNNPFRAIVVQERMFILGDEGEAHVAEEGASTSRTIKLRENSWVGIEKGTKPQILQSLLVFVQRGGRDVRGIQWTEQQQRYDVISLTDICGPILDKPIVDVARGESTHEYADTLYCVMEDGRMAVATIRSQQPALAWCMWDCKDLSVPNPDYDEDRPEGEDNLKNGVSHGKIRNAAVVKDRPYFLVEREGKLWLERLSEPDEGGKLLDVGSWPYTCRIETVPVLQQQQNGPVMFIGRVRLLKLVVNYGSRVPPELYISDSRGKMKRQRSGRPPSNRDDANRIASYGSLAGWRKRSTLTIDVPLQSRITSLNYRAAN